MKPARLAKPIFLPTGVLLALICFMHTTGAVSVDYSAPKFLEGPVVANSFTGTTYAYRSREPSKPTALQITIVELPDDPNLRDAYSADHCINLFLAEVARNKQNFFALPTSNELNVGEMNLQQVRWTRKDTNVGMTGVTSCVRDGNRYVSINFQDGLKNARDTFPAIRDSLVDLGIHP
ncbi:MAG: hypothetical protein ACU84Q_18610 [Gammaproteobacteria bacterium]